MSSSYQQQARTRKIAYIVAVAVLLTTSYFVRVFVVEAKAEALSLREANVGEVEVSGSAARLLLTGSRGVAVCGLWYSATEAQKKHRWNELELYVRSLTKLQPHFISPWLFQTWNLSYNVSVESDQVRDKLFYVSKGVELLAEGERKNRHNPEMRYQIGMFQQHKICQSDETNVFRCLYQMAVIPPLERHKSRFYKSDGQTFDHDYFKTFCDKNPQLVRRLFDRLRKKDPEEIVAFLDDNFRVPSLYEDDLDKHRLAEKDGTTPPLRPLTERWPVVPPQHTAVVPIQEAQDEPVNANELGTFATDSLDAFLVARAWYSYAVEAVPQSDPDRPGRPLEIKDPRYQRLPKMTVALFRNFPPLAAKSIGERLEAEGWFDKDGWTTPAWFRDEGAETLRPRKIGTNKDWARDAYADAFARWEAHGKKTGLYLDPREEAEKRELARRYWTKFGLQLGSQPPERPDLKPGDEDYDGYKAALYMHFYDYTRTLSSFASHYHRTEVEAKEEVVQARKAFFEADRLRAAGNREQAIARYERKEFANPLDPNSPVKVDLLELWRNILIRFPNFRTRDDFQQEESFKTQMKYVGLLEARDGHRFKLVTNVAGALMRSAAPTGPEWVAALHQNLLASQPALQAMPEVLPLESRRVDVKFKEDPNDPDDKAQEIIPESVKTKVLVEMGRRRPYQPTEEEVAQFMQQRGPGGMKPPPTVNAPLPPIPPKP